MSEAERQQSAQRRVTTAAAVEAATRRSSSLRSRAPRCDRRKSRLLRDEALKQVTEAAQQIVRANVEKAKAGSLTHTKWLLSLMEAQQDEETLPKVEERQSLAEFLMEQLRAKQ